MLFIFATSYLVGLSGALSPGPLLAYSIRESARRGFWAGPYLSLGHALMELIVVILLSLGLKRFLEAEAVEAAIAMLGGASLILMAWGILRNPGKDAPSLEGYPSSPRAGDSRGAILGGALVSLANPFWFVWWITVGAAFLVKANPIGWLGIGAFYLGHILSDLSWYSLVTFGVAYGRKIMRQRLYKRVMVICGLFLGAMGIYFLAFGAGTLA